MFKETNKELSAELICAKLVNIEILATFLFPTGSSDLSDFLSHLFRGNSSFSLNFRRCIDRKTKKTHSHYRHKQIDSPLLSASDVFVFLIVAAGFKIGACLKRSSAFSVFVSQVFGLETIRGHGGWNQRP